MNLFWLSIDNQPIIRDQINLQTNRLMNNRFYFGGHHLIGKIDSLIDLDFFDGCIYNISLRKDQTNSTFNLMNKIIISSNVVKCLDPDCK